MIEPEFNPEEFASKYRYMGGDIELGTVRRHAAQITETLLDLRRDTVRVLQDMEIVNALIRLVAKNTVPGGTGWYLKQRAAELARRWEVLRSLQECHGKALEWLRDEEDRCLHLPPQVAALEIARDAQDVPEGDADTYLDDEIPF